MIEPRLLNLINSIFNLVFVLSFIFLAGVIIYLGIIYIISSEGNKLKEVHKKWWLLLVGIVLIFLSLTIPRLIGMFFNINIEILR